MSLNIIQQLLVAIAIGFFGGLFILSKVDGARYSKFFLILGIFFEVYAGVGLGLYFFLEFPAPFQLPLWIDIFLGIAICYGLTTLFVAFKLIHKR